MISAIGSLLPDSMKNPDIINFISIEQKGGHSIGQLSTFTASMPCKFNKLGYIPVISTISGIGRSLMGLIYTITHLVLAIFKKDKDHLREVVLGAKNIGRGLVEAIPVIGNVSIFIIDLKRMNKLEKMAKEEIQRNQATYNNQVIMFTYRKEVAKMPISELQQELSKLKVKPSAANIANILSSRVSSAL